MNDDLETPAAVVRLAVAARADLERVRLAFVEGARLLEGIEDALRVLPSSQSRLKGWRNQLDNVVASIADEQEEIARKMCGEVLNPITETVNEALVVQLRREA